MRFIYFLPNINAGPADFLGSRDLARESGWSYQFLPKTKKATDSVKLILHEIEGVLELILKINIPHSNQQDVEEMLELTICVTQGRSKIFSFDFNF